MLTILLCLASQLYDTKSYCLSLTVLSFPFGRSTLSGQLDTELSLLVHLSVGYRWRNNGFNHSIPARGLEFWTIIYATSCRTLIYMLMGYIDISATYLDMVKSVSTPYLVRIKVPLLGVDTDLVRRWHGGGYTLMSIQDLIWNFLWKKLQFPLFITK